MRETFQKVLHNKMLVTILMVSLINIASKGIGFVRESIMAAFFGASSVTDAYISAGSIVTLFFMLISAMVTLHIPMITEDIERTDGDDILTSQFIQAVIIVALILGLILFLLRDYIINLVVPGFDYQEIILTEQFLFFAAMSYVCTTVNQIFVNRLNYNGYFITATLTTILCGLFQIFGIYIAYKRANLFYLNSASTVGAIAQLFALILIVFVTHSTFKNNLISFTFLRRLLYLAAPIAFSTVIDEICVITDKIFASSLESGIISCMNYAHMIKQVFFWVIVSAVVNVLYPMLTRFIVEKKVNRVNSLLQDYIWCMMVILVPITIGAILYSEYITQIIYGHGSFNNWSIEITSRVFSMYIIALFPLVIREFLQRVLYAFQDVKNTFKINVVMGSSNIVCNIILFPIFRQNGLALATAISAYIAVGIYFIKLRKRKIIIDWTFLFKELIFILINSLLCILPLYFGTAIIKSSMAPLVSIFTSALLYLLVLLLFRNKIIMSIIKQTER